MIHRRTRSKTLEEGRERRTHCDSSLPVGRAARRTYGYFGDRREGTRLRESEYQVQMSSLGHGFKQSLQP